MNVFKLKEKEKIPPRIPPSVFMFKLRRLRRVFIKNEKMKVFMFKLRRLRRVFIKKGLAVREKIVIKIKDLPRRINTWRKERINFLKESIVIWYREAVQEEKDRIKGAILLAKRRFKYKRIYFRRYLKYTYTGTFIKHSCVLWVFYIYYMLVRDFIDIFF